MNTNVERKGKEKPKERKNERKEEREPTNHTQFEKRNERQAGIKLFHLYHSRWGKWEKMYNSETCWCRWRGWNCVGECFARFGVSLSGTHGRETSTALPVSTSFFWFVFEKLLFSLLAFLLQNKKGGRVVQ